MGKVQEIVVADLVSRMKENNDLVWERPWNSVGLMPMNLRTGNLYSGSNVLLLSFSHFDSPYWVTEKQAESFGGVKREGERPRLIIFYKPKDKDKPDSYRMMRFYAVFNTDQWEGIEHTRLDELKTLAVDNRTESERIDIAEALLESYAKRGAEVVHGLDFQPCYNPLKDLIRVPERHQYEKIALYYKTRFHEHAHDTGHRTRLEREGIVNHVRFADHTYSVEELIAESTAAMLSHHVGLYEETAQHSAAYVQSWINKLESDPQMLFTAGAAAQKAFNYILGVDKKA